METRTGRRDWPLAIIVLAALGFIVLSMWWMSENFGAMFAMAVAGSLVGALLVSWGVVMNHASTKGTLENAADFNRSLALTEKARQMTYREGAKGEREAFNARAKLVTIDEKRIDQIAQQRARLLAGPTQAEQQPDNRWMMEDDFEDETVDARWYE